MTGPRRFDRLRSHQERDIRGAPFDNLSHDTRRHGGFDLLIEIGGNDIVLEEGGHVLWGARPIAVMEIARSGKSSHPDTVENSTLFPFLSAVIHPGADDHPRIKICFEFAEARHKGVCLSTYLYPRMRGTPIFLGLLLVIQVGPLVIEGQSRRFSEAQGGRLVLRPAKVEIPGLTPVPGVLIVDYLFQSWVMDGLDVRRPNIDEVDRIIEPGQSSIGK